MNSTGLCYAERRSQEQEGGEAGARGEGREARGGPPANEEIRVRVRRRGGDGPASVLSYLCNQADEEGDSHPHHPLGPLLLYVRYLPEEVEAICRCITELLMTHKVF